MKFFKCNQHGHGSSECHLRKTVHLVEAMEEQEEYKEEAEEEFDEIDFAKGNVGERF